jgi:hypothetical protein
VCSMGLCINELLASRELHIYEPGLDPPLALKWTGVFVGERSSQMQAGTSREVSITYFTAPEALFLLQRWSCRRRVKFMPISQACQMSDGRQTTLHCTFTGTTFALFGTLLQECSASCGCPCRFMLSLLRIVQVGLFCQPR